MGTTASVRHSGPPSTDTAFNKFPIELNWHIAHYLVEDKDIANLRLVCRSTRDAIDGDMGSFWRTKFRSKYAYAVDKAGNNTELREEYQKRAKYLRRGLTEKFSNLGWDKSEKKILEVLRLLIVESFQGGHAPDVHGRPWCPNQQHLLNFMANSRHFLGIKPTARHNDGSPRSRRNTDYHGFFAAVQLMCAQLLLQQNVFKYSICSFEESQKMVYMHHILGNKPLFHSSQDGLRVKMDWALHCVNFFRHHIVGQECSFLKDDIDDLPVEERPSAWRTPLVTGIPAWSRKWKGTYAFLKIPELRRMRARGNADEPFIDRHLDDDEESTIQDLQLDLIGDDMLPWPKAFEDRLKSRPMPYPQHRSTKTLPAVRLTGEGLDQGDNFFMSGWVNPLEPQFGIPGWHRITMMKHFDENYNNLDADHLWAYEGVVLPGGRLIVGRWWYASEHPTSAGYAEDSGPFILWAVDEEPDIA